MVAREKLERVGDRAPHHAVDRHLGAGGAAVAARAQVEPAGQRGAFERRLDRGRLANVDIALLGLEAAQLDDDLGRAFGQLEIDGRVAGDPEIPWRRRRSHVPVDDRLLRRAVDVDLVCAPLDPGARLGGRSGGGLRRGRRFAGPDDAEQPCETDQQGDPREQRRTHHGAARVTADRRTRQLDAARPRNVPSRRATHMSPLISGIQAFFVVGGDTDL